MTLILADWLVAGSHTTPQAGWRVRAEGSTIDSVGTHRELRATFPEDDAVDASGSVLQDPGTMPASRVLRMATEGAARALGLDRVGRLETGWAADLQLVDIDFPTPVTEHNLLEQLVLWRRASNVNAVMVVGRWRVRGGEVLDANLDLLNARTNEQPARLWSRA